MVSTSKSWDSKMVRARFSMVMASATCCWYWARSRLMKAVMARILGRAGSGGALRWAWEENEAKGISRKSAIKRNKEKRTLPRRIGLLQKGHSRACLPQAGCAPTRYRIRICLCGLIWQPLTCIHLTTCTLAEGVVQALA